MFVTSYLWPNIFYTGFYFYTKGLEIKLFYMASVKYTVHLHRHLAFSLGQNSPYNWTKSESRAWKSLHSDLYATGRWQKTAQCSSSCVELSLCCNAATHHFQLPGKTLTHKDDTSSKPTCLPIARLECCIFWAQWFCVQFLSWRDSPQTSPSRAHIKQTLLCIRCNVMLLQCTSLELSCHSLL